MTTIINGSSPSVTFSDGTTQTTAGLPLTGGTVTGNVTINGNIIQGANTAPCFAAYSNVTQSIATGTSTVVTFNNKLFDTNTNYSTSTNRFTPTVAGYYQISASAGSQTSSVYLSAGQYLELDVYKNGTTSSAIQTVAALTAYATPNLTGILYMNGSTDYVDLRLIHVSGTTLSFQGYNFSAAMVRSA